MGAQVDDNAILKTMKLNWLQKLDLVGFALTAFGLLLTIAGSFLGNFEMLFAFPIAILVNFFLRWFQTYYFYEQVKCPICHARLNYFKNGNKVPDAEAWSRLRRGQGCRCCDWSPHQ